MGRRVVSPRCRRPVRPRSPGHGPLPDLLRRRKGHEVVRLVESVGPDVLGITFDTANVLVRGEDPVAAARRVAPDVRATHLRDSALGVLPDGLGCIFAAVGQGVIDWPGLMGELFAAAPDLHASIEPAGSTLVVPSPYRDPIWRDAHPNLDDVEVDTLVRLAEGYDKRAANGEVPAFADLPNTLYDGDKFITSSAAILRKVLADLGDGLKADGDAPRS